MTIQLVELMKIALAAGAVFVAIAAFVVARLSQSKEAGPHIEERTAFRLWRWSWSAKQMFLAVVFAYGGLTVASAYRFSMAAFFDLYDEYDILHYYLNAKYSDELGYDRLYPAMIVADSESKQLFEGKISKYRETKAHEYRRVEDALEQSSDIRAKFSKERWKSFVKDFNYIAPRIPIEKWKTILQDRGYNGTPVWNLIGRFLGNLVDIRDVKLLCLLDVLLIAAMLWAILWAFGPLPMAMTLIFIGVSYSFRWPMVGYSVLRYDWIVALISGAAFLKKGHYKLAGALFGYATLMRIFPAVFMFGLLAKGVWGVIAQRQIPWTSPFKRIIAGVPRHYWIMAGAMVLTIAVGVGVAMARDGSHAFADHFDDLRVHMLPKNLSSQRCGLGTALVFDLSKGSSKGYISDDKKLEVGDKEPLKYAIALVLLLLLGIGVKKLEDHDAVLIGFIPFFLLSIASYYYYVMRMTVVVYHAHGIDKPRNAVALAFLFLIESVVWIAELTTDSRFYSIGWMGWLLLAYSLVVISPLLYGFWSERRAKQ